MNELAAVSAWFTKLAATFSPGMLKEMGTGILETVYMTFLSTGFAYLIGLPLGIALVLTASDGIRPARTVNRVLDIVVNIFRSVPFLILLVLLLPFSRMIVGTTVGPTAMIPPLVIAAAPFVARLIESSLREVDRGVIEAAKSMGAGLYRIVTRVLLPEAKTSLIVGAAIATTTILSYSAMAGFVGGGGLGDIALRYGLHRYKTDIMLVNVVLLVLIVQGMQAVGMGIAKKLNRK